MSKRKIMAVGAIWFALIIGAGQVYPQGSFTETNTPEPDTVVIPFSGMQVNPRADVEPTEVSMQATATAEPVVVNNDVTVNIPESQPVEVVVDAGSIPAWLDYLLRVVAGFAVIPGASPLVMMLMQLIKALYRGWKNVDMSSAWAVRITAILHGLIWLVAGWFISQGVSEAQVDDVLGQIALFLQTGLTLLTPFLLSVGITQVGYNTLTNRNVPMFRNGTEPTKTVG